jgi:hypothetical protein
VNLTGAALFFKIGKRRIQPGVYRLKCPLCGITGREHVPKLGANYTAGEADKAVRAHAGVHVERALEEHLERCLEKQKAKSGK